MNTTPLLENICKTTFPTIKHTIKQLDIKELRSMHKLNKYIIVEQNGKSVYYSDYSEPSLISVSLSYIKTKPNLIDEIEDIIIGEFVKKHSI